MRSISAPIRILGPLALALLAPSVGAQSFYGLAGGLNYAGPAPSLPPSVPAGLQAIRDNCLAKDPTDRYQHGGEILTALRALQSGERIASRTQPRLSRRVVAGIALAVLAATAAISWLVFTRGDGATPAVPSIAVLPLRDTSGGGEPAYFADGVTDALIDRL